MVSMEVNMNLPLSPKLQDTFKLRLTYPQTEAPVSIGLETWQNRVHGTHGIRDLIRPAADLEVVVKRKAPDSLGIESSSLRQ